MANEIEMSARLFASKGGASINPNVWTAVVNMTGRDMGQQTQDVGTTQETLDLTADLTAPYKVLIYNMDLQNSVKVGTALPFEFEIPPQEFILLPRVNATLYVMALNSTCKIFAQFCEI